MSRTNSLKIVFLTFVILLLTPARTAAWGNRGHQIIARIAMTRLSSGARETIAQLLEPGETLESISTWADGIKTQRAETRSWHYVAIPLTDNRYSRAKDCKREETCIIDAITQQISILKDDTRDAKERAEALKFLVHLVGDLHQPFHVTTNTNPQDLAGSWVRVTSLSGGATNLANIWDNDLVDYGLKQSARSVTDYTNQLNKKFRSSNNQNSPGTYISTQGSITDWALATHNLAWDAYYHSNGEFMVADRNRSWKLDQAYYDKNVPSVEAQMVRAGVRLAKILNDVFTSKAKY